MRLALRAAEQSDVITTRQLAACGLGANAIAVRVRRGQLHRVHQGVYAVGTGVLTLKGTLSAAVLACGENAVLSHYAAAAWHGMLRWEDRWPDVITPHGAGRAVSGIRSHRSASLHEYDVWRRDGILVTSRERTVLDLAAELAPNALRRMVRQALAEGRLSIARLAKVLARSPRHRGTRALRALLAAWHGDRLTREHDAQRQARLEARGYRVLRVTWRQIVEQPRQTLARIRAALGFAEL